MQGAGAEDISPAQAADDAAGTPLGAREAWPATLRNAVDLISASRFPMFILWGPERRLIYNRGYQPILGARHPAAMGADFLDIWPEVRSTIAPIIADAFAGRSSLFADLPVVLHRDGGPEQTWFTFSYSPIRDDDGAIAGVLCVCVETTEEMRARRRQGFLIALETQLRALADPIAIIAAAQSALGTHFGVSRVGYGTVDESERFFTTDRNWTDGSVPHHNGTHDLAAFGEAVFGAIRRGESLRVDDAERDTRAEDPAAAAAFAALEIRAALTVSLIKQDRLVAVLYLHDRTPRHWSDDDLRLAEEVAERTWSAVERAQAEAALRAQAERQSFLLALGDRLRGIADAEAIKAAAAEALGRTLGVPRVGYGEIDAAGQRVTVERDWTDGTMASLAGETRNLDVFGPAIIARLRTGEILRLDDIAADPLSAPYAAGYASIGTRALLVVPLIKAGRFTAILYLHAAAPRAWRDEESLLAAEVAERTWASVEKARAEAALHRLNATLEAEVAARTLERDRMWRLSRDIFLVIGGDARIEAVNPAVRRLGYRAEDLLGQDFAAFLHPDDVAPARTAAAAALSGTVADVETRLRGAGGGWHWIAWTGATDGGKIHCVGRDVTAEKARQAELAQVHEALRQSQKLEAMGQLTGGVAHDFNNLLTPIIGSLDLLQRRGIGNAREARLIGGALQSADRAKTLVQRLLAFARRQPLQPRSVDIGVLVDGMRDLIASTIGPRIRLDIGFADDLPPALADPNQLEMALLNLSVNARDAMPDGGTLSLRVDAEQVRRGHLSDLCPGPYLHLCIADTGTGMDADTAKRAIEPFFSTKGVGQGTGLGLSMVHGLASQLGGALTIDSAPGEGTRIGIWLPASTSAAEAPVDTAVPADVPSASGTVLLVDDEEAVRATTADMLADLGFTVIETDSAEAALARLEAGAAIDLLVSDHLMPGMTGTALVREARQLRPGLPVLIISGYAEAEGVAPELPRLTKPFRQSDLAAAIAESRRNG
ncbi:GAF domain-containing protein [Sphingosinicella sp. BN140058]|uniref:GAF domain-containing protein n=1 Tax=Sphingosinicella sp. BN140058 TaxID=1892855 RepID=UPI00101176B8|nr:GAF domain-containing protein [Sphingosinicella sp. BN140058]QAY77563.1 hybrid sensor histidine kinase/response regulator [Sphingosinicella sp. BN140058]